MTMSRYYLAPAALGLGDLVVTLPVVQSMVERGLKTWLVLRSADHIPLAERIVGLHGCRVEWEMPSRQELEQRQDILIDMRDHDLQRNYWWGGKEFEEDFPGWKINDILRTICGDKNLLDVNFDMLKPLRFNRLRQLPAAQAKKWNNLDQAVILIPGSAVTAKTWGVERWLELVRMLKVAGTPSVMVGEPWKSAVVRKLMDSGVPCLSTPSVADAIDAISNCKAVISVDTGLMHLAVQQGIPTIGLYKHSPVYVREQPHFVTIAAQRPCSEECFRREQKCAHHNRKKAGPKFKPADWDCAATNGIRCIDTIEADRVLSGLEILMYVRNTAPPPQRNHHRQFTNPIKVSIRV